MRATSASLARLAIAASCSLPLAVAAQSPADSCVGRVPVATDTEVVTISLSWLAGRRDRAPLAEFRESALAAIVARIVPPRALTIPGREYSGLVAFASLATPSRDSSHVFRVYDDSIAFVLDPAGHVSNLTITETSVTPAMEAAIVRAIHAADSAGALAFGPSVGNEPIGVTLWMHDGIPPATSASVALLRIALPGYRVDRDVSVATRVPPRYPQDALSVAVEDALTAHFVVGVDGRADMSTLVFVAGTYRQFAASVRDALPKYRFHPAV